MLTFLTCILLDFDFLTSLKNKVIHNLQWWFKAKSSFDYNVSLHQNLAYTNRTKYV